MNDDQVRRLWAAKLQRMLLDATGEIVCYQGGREERERFRQEAITWFEGDSPDFRATCETAGFDPAVVRAKVLRMIERERQLHLDRVVAKHGPVIGRVA